MAKSETQKINKIMDVKGQQRLFNTQKYMGIKEHYHKNQDQAVQDQCFNNHSVWSRILEQRIEVSQNGCLRRIPQHLLVKYYLEHSLGHSTELATLKVRLG